jgi:hypothetical protein
MSFLNCVERGDQDLLVDILPQLCQDLANKKLDTLTAYHFEWTHMNMKDNGPQSDLDHYLLGEMCIQAARGVELQCKREYWSSEEDTTSATAIYALHEDQRKNLPANNLNTERYKIWVSCCSVGLTLEQAFQSEENQRRSYADRKICR